MIRAASCTATPRMPFPYELHLADVNAGANSQPLSRRRTTNRLGAVKRAGRPVEGRQHPVAGRVHLAAAEPVELGPSRLEVRGQQLAPSRVAQLVRHHGRIDEICEEEGHERATLESRPEPGERVQACPFDLDARFVSDRPAVVAGRDVEDVVGPELQRPPVSQLHGDAAGEDDTEMTRLAPLAADRRADVDRPPPSRLRDQVADGQAADLDQLGGQLVEPKSLVGPREVLRLELGHAHMIARPRDCGVRERDPAVAIAGREELEGNLGR
jgi:hypothetical protein